MISVEYTITDLNQLIYNFAFDYLKKKYIKVSSKNITTGVVTKYTYGVDYVVVDSTIELLHTVGAVGDVLRIVRETSTSEQVVSWNDASILKAKDMSLAQLQQLHILEEYSEYMSINSLSLDINGQYDAKNSRIVNLASPQTATDAVNKDYVDSITGTLLTAKQSVTLSQSWAIGDILNRPEGSSKYWATISQFYAKQTIEVNQDALGLVTTAIYESTGAGIISGFNATTSGNIVLIEAGIAHMITGHREETTITNITTNIADVTNPRIDLIYLSSDGVVSYLEGTSAVNPTVPSVPTGGLALWSLLITTSGTITLTDLRVFKTRYQNNGMVSVMDFGNVVGDGITDDTTAIQKAIDYCAVKDLPLKFPKGSYRVTQIVLRNKGRYYFEKGSVIIKSANICAVVNESIDSFGAGTSYTSPDSILTADAVDAMDTIYVDGLTVKKATSNYQSLTYAQQCSYKGYKWVVSPSLVSDFPVSFVGLRDSTIKNVTITDLQVSANINLGFSLRTVVVDCILHQGVDGCLQFFACIQCTAKSNRCKNGGGGMIAFQACNRCLALGNLITYDASLSFTPVNYQCLAIKGCLNCVASGNIIDGTSVANSQGITVAQQDGESHSNIITNNTIRHCDLGLCNDGQTTTGTVFANNTLLDCGKTSNIGSISLVAGHGIVIKGNTVRGSISHNVWINNGVNFVNIKDNLFEETAPYMSMVLFYDGNTTTTNYSIRDNIMKNSVPNTNVRGIMFASGASQLYYDKLISGNVFVGIGDVLRLSTTKAGTTIFQQSDIWTTLPLSIRNLSVPTVFDSGPFSVTRTAVGTYTITIGANVTGSLFRVRSVQASYKLGYSPRDFNGCRIGIAYNDYSNPNRSINAINLTLTDINGNLTDNPTSNGNAATSYNFGIDLLITYQIDPSGI